MARILDLINPEPYYQASISFYNASQTLESLAEQHSANSSYGAQVLQNARYALNALPIDPGFYLDPTSFTMETGYSYSNMRQLAGQLLTESRQLQKIGDAAQQVLQLLTATLAGAGLTIGGVASALNDAVSNAGSEATLLGEDIPGLDYAGVVTQMASTAANGGDLHKVIGVGLGGGINIAAGVIPGVGEATAAMSLVSWDGKMYGQLEQDAGTAVAQSDPTAGAAMEMSGSSLATAADRLDPSHTFDALGTLCEDAAQPFAIGTMMAGGDPLGGMINVGVAAITDPSFRSTLWNDTTNLLGSVGNLGLSIPELGSNLISTGLVNIFGGGAALAQNFMPPSPFRNDIVNFGNTAASTLATGSAIVTSSFGF